MAKDETRTLDPDVIAELLLLAEGSPESFQPERKIELALDMLEEAQESLQAGRLKAAHVILMGAVHALVLAAMNISRRAIPDDALQREAGDAPGEDPS